MSKLLSTTYQHNDKSFEFEIDTNINIDTPGTSNPDADKLPVTFGFNFKVKESYKFGFICALCDDQTIFPTYRSLKNGHFHPREERKKKNKKHYRVHCLTCERNYFCVRGPLAHLKRVHLDLKYHMCHKCSYKFLTEKIAIYMSPYAATKILDFDIINMKFL